MAKKSVKKKVTKKKVAKKKVNPNYAEMIAGIQYPWNKPKRLLNIFWYLIPIIGWLAILGYKRKIVNYIVNGDTKALPEFGSFFDNMTEGFFIFIKLIPLVAILTIASIMLGLIPVLGTLVHVFIWLIFFPYILVHFFVHSDFAATFDWDRFGRNVLNKNFGDYMLAVIKTIAFRILYVIASIVLVGIPALCFGRYFFIADYYAKNRK